jgi:hypothetical protein
MRLAHTWVGRKATFKKGKRKRFFSFAPLLGIVHFPFSHLRPRAHKTVQEKCFPEQNAYIIVIHAIRGNPVQRL